MEELTAFLEVVEYTLRTSVGGFVAGVHRGILPGSTGRFDGYTPLTHRPDLRRIDPVATQRARSPVPLVRRYRSTVAVPVVALVDLTASMAWTGRYARLREVAKICVCLAYSAYRLGDRFGLIGYREEGVWYVPPSRSPQQAWEIGAGLWDYRPPELRAGTRRVSLTGFYQALTLLPNSMALVLWISDFYLPEDVVRWGLAHVHRHDAVAVVLRDPVETQGQLRDGRVRLMDAETGTQRSLWVRPRLRAEIARRVRQWDAWLREECRRLDVDFYPVVEPFRVETFLSFFLERRWGASPS
ncbi:MAG: hypothetical protein NZ742_00355 [Acidobacteria bacterium]|nr:hypothetical protein [Acidobacteriota bacterium]MDW7983237.1 hypothetical protein [Acidobacteriota bacterium]